MKIGSFDNSKPAPLASTSNNPNAGAAPAAKAAAPEASAKVALSPAAAVLVNASNADFNADKVARIAQAIREGKFEINAEAIADGLLAHNRELLTRREQ
jgi:negative regulator of flagellin synthesis FlgM